MNNFYDNYKKNCSFVISMKRENHFNLQAYIQELLYRYDLVIIPGFGGIIGRRKPARYNPNTHLFSPPYKDISFNSGLTESDGLLVNYIAGKLEVSHNQAMEMINDEMMEWKKQLQEHKRLILENIGIFTSVNNKIIFQPLLNKNFLADSYGLTSFIKTKRPQSTRKIDLVNQLTNPKPEEFININKKSSKAKEYLKYAAFFVIGFALLGGGLFVYNHSDEVGSFQKATFVVEKELPPVKVTETADIEIKTTSETTQEPVDVSSDESIEAEDVNVSSNNLVNYKYQIIVGGFLYKQNAEKKLKNLIKNGYKAQIIGKNNKGLYLVAVEGGNDLKYLRKKLPKICQLEPDAWIYRSK